MLNSAAHTSRWNAVPAKSRSSSKRWRCPAKYSPSWRAVSRSTPCWSSRCSSPRRTRLSRSCSHSTAASRSPRATRVRVPTGDCMRVKAQDMAGSGRMTFAALYPSRRGHASAFLPSHRHWPVRSAAPYTEAPLVFQRTETQ
ncbi:hypothetical protein WR25_08769 [Diploscapter pachys]|uniref:Uncharacterized protein n=1 Tax=Diploscapter pachys TaxID=2018661 RepID=A0A2A2JWU5_9BILA|nr:hypothetical protein WR25_08769 [Diploscapter pachys]